MKTPNRRPEVENATPASSIGAIGTTYWTIAEGATFARISPKRLRNLMANGTLREGVHYTRPRGLRPRLKREAFDSWLEGDAPVTTSAATTKRATDHVPAIDLTLLERVGIRRDGV